MDFVVVPADLQLLIVAFIALQWWAISQHLGQRSFFRYWTWGWSWLAILVAMSRTATTIGGDGPPLLLDALRVGIVVAGLLQLFFFAVGGWLLDGRRTVSRRQLLGGVVMATALGVVIGAVSLNFSEPYHHGLAIRLALRDSGLAIVFLYSGWKLFSQRHPDQALAYGVTSGALILFGSHQLYYAAGDISTLVEVMTGGGLLPYDSRVVLDGMNWLIDMVLSIAIGAGTVLLLVAEARRSRGEIQRREAEFRGTFDHAPIGMALLDEKGSVLRVNQALADLLELTPTALRKTHLSDYIADGGIDFYAPQARRYTVTLRTGSGRPVRGLLDVSALPKDKTGHRRFIVQLLDVTDQHNLQERLSHLAMHDSVTGLPNRAYFEEHIHAASKRMQRRNEPMVVMFIDLNEFKPINDTYGHAAGDNVLQVVARRILSAVREGDFVSRYGGDEFVVVLEESPGAKCVNALARRIVDTISQPLTFSGGELSPSASLGAVISQLTDDAQELVRAADAAMYRAKRTRANHIEIIDRSGPSAIVVNS